MRQATVKLLVLVIGGALVTAAPSALAEPAPPYELRYIPTREIACSFSSLSTVTGMQVKEYVFYQLAPEPTPRQQLSPMTLHNNPAPGTGFSDTTYRYPPPQPEYIAPGYFA